MADEQIPARPPTPRRWRLGPFLFIGILFLGLGLTAISYTVWPAVGFLREAIALDIDSPGAQGTEANWNMMLGMGLGLVSFIGGILCLGGAFLIRTHLRDQAQ